MALSVIRNDITKVEADIIVNTANPKPIYANGVDHAIYEAAGPEKLLEERKKIGELNPGDVAVTPAFKLNAKYIIHAVGPWWEGGDKGEFDILRQCYSKSLNKAVELGCSSIAFPLMATGTYGFPKDKALKIALNEIQSFLLENELRVLLVVFDPASVVLTGKLYDKIRESINDQYSKALAEQEYVKNDHKIQGNLTDDEFAELYNRRYRPGFTGIAPEIKLNRVSRKERIKNRIDESIKDSGMTFATQVFEYIDASGEKPSDIYNRADISRSVYSRMLNEMEKYHPKKDIAIKWCLGLKLNIEQAEELLGLAGYTFNPGIIEDVVVKACIENKEYDLVQVELMILDRQEQVE